MPAVKVLLSGDVGGQLGALFKRVEAVSRKAGPFDALLCVGDFLGPPVAGQGEEAGLEGCELAAFVAAGGRAPLPTYFIGALHPPHSLLLDALAASDCGIRYLGRRVAVSGAGRDRARSSGARGREGRRRADVLPPARRISAAASQLPPLGCRRIAPIHPSRGAGPAWPTSAVSRSPSWTACLSQSAVAARPPPAPMMAPRGGSAPRRTLRCCRRR
jgi:hypothetical protein